MPATLTVYSGINGFVGNAADSAVSLPAAPTNTINAIGKWDINHKAELSEVASSATAQAMDRVAGNDDWDGNYMAYGDSPAYFPGDFLMIYGFVTSSTVGPLAKYMSGRGIVDEVSVKLDIEGAKEIEHSVKMSCAYNGIANGQLNPSATEVLAPYDSSPMNVASAAGCVVAIALPASTPASQTWYVLKDVRSVDLSLKTSNKNYHSSATANLDQSIATGGSPGGIWRNWCGRVRGNMDATVSVTQYAIPEELIPNKAILGVRIYTTPPPLTEFSAGATFLRLDGTTSNSAPGIAVTGTLQNSSAARYWEVDWIQFQAHSGIEVDRKTANILGATTNGGLKAVANISNLYLTASGGTPTFGMIKPPAYGSVGSSYLTPATYWWPWTLPRS